MVFILKGHKYDRYRANAEEGKGTYEGMRKSQNPFMLFIRIVMFVLVIFIVGFVSISIQGYHDNHSCKQQAHIDVSKILNRPAGNISTKDMNHQ